MSRYSSTDRQRTPWHLRLVGVIAMLWSAMGVVDFLMTQTRNETYMSQFTPEQLEFFFGFPPWLTACWAIAVWGGLLGGILLLTRKRFAYPAFLLSFLAMLVTTVHSYLFSNGLEVMGDGPSLIFSAVIFLVASLLVVYARAMKRRRVLH